MNRGPRSADRRVSDRRHADADSAPAQSWFGALGPGVGVDMDVEAQDAGPDSESLALAQAFEESRLDETGAAPADAEQTAFERIYRTFIGARAVLGLTLAVALVAAAPWSSRSRPCC